MISLDTFDRLGPGLRSSLPETERGSSYDKMAFGYDVLVGNALYNRLVWGCSIREYEAAACSVLADAPGGDILDFGCGSCVFTATAYRGNEHRIILFDRSLGMIKRAQKRLPLGRFLQGDALDTPFEDDQFDGIMSWGMAHIFGSDSSYMAELARLLRPGGRVAMSSLALTGRKTGDRMLAMLQQKGEAIAESSATICDAFGRHFILESATTTGNMLFMYGKSAVAD